MKNKILKTVSTIISVAIISYSAIIQTSAERMVYVLSDENYEKAMEFINADDRVGLYDFLYDVKGVDINNPQDNYYFIAFTTNFTGSYVLDDMNYNAVIKYFVMPYDADNPYPPLATAPPIIGDANMDGKVSLFDTIMVNKMVIGAIKPQNIIQAQAADVDGSCVIDMDDVDLIMKYTVDLIDTFPVEQIEYN